MIYVVQNYSKKFKWINYLKDTIFNTFVSVVSEIDFEKYDDKLLYWK